MNGFLYSAQCKWRNATQHYAHTMHTLGLTLILILTLSLTLNPTLTLNLTLISSYLTNKHHLHGAICIAPNTDIPCEHNMKIAYLTFQYILACIRNALRGRAIALVGLSDHKMEYFASLLSILILIFKETDTDIVCKKIMDHCLTFLSRAQ